MIKSYYKKDGKKYYLFKIYMGADPVTNKKRFTTRRGFKTQKEAKLAMARLQTEIKDKGIPNNTNITFKDIYELWFAQHKNTVKVSSYEEQDRRAKKHILPRFGHIKLSKLTVAYCQKQANEWFSYYKSYSALISLTSSILDYAVKLGYLSSDPMKNIIKPKKIKNVDDQKYQAPFYNQKQLKKFFDVLKENQGENSQTFMMFRVLAFTGMRKGELLGLRWCDVDFINKTITIKQTLVSVNDGLTFQTPKTRKSERTISIDDITMNMLSKWKKLQKEKYFSLGYNTSHPDQLVFTNRKNNPIHPSRLNIKLNEIISCYNLDKITIHGFRHTHCSLLFEAGATIKEVQERLGHSNIKTTMDIYAHVTDKAKNETAQKFSSYVNF